MSLAGRGVVVTRPREQAQGLAQRIEAAGGRALLYPALEIQALEDLQPVLARIDRLEDFDFAIFISPNAVHKAMNLVRARRGDAPWPAAVRVAAVGRGSRNALATHGLREVLAPQAAQDSEALLALPAFAEVTGKRVVVFRGEGGRELLGDTLTRRGARVEYAECYRRTRPRTDCAPLLAAWARGAVHAVTVSSAEGLVNFFEMLGKLGERWLRDTPLFVPHARVAEAAARLGVRQVLVAGPSDDEMLERLVAYFEAAK